MENRRFLLICVLGVLLYFAWQAWQRDHAPQPQAVAAAELPDSEAEAPADEDEPLAPSAPSSPAADSDSRQPDADARVIARTDVLEVELSTRGGALRRVALLDYPVSKDRPDLPVELITDRNGRLFVIQGGMTTPAGALASHRDLFEPVGGLRHELADGADQLTVTLRRVLADGSEVLRHYRFTRGSYQVGVRTELRNAGIARTVSPYWQLWREDFSLGSEPPFIQSFSGVGIYEQKPGSDSYRFRKYTAEDLAEEPVRIAQTGGWITMMQHYFLAAVIPPADEALQFSAQPARTRGYLARYLGQAREVAPGEQAVFEQRLYIGPKLQDRLGDIAPGFELTVDYGILTPIAELLFTVLSLLHDLLGNWGWAIVALTVLVKASLYKLSEAQYRSMAKMRKFAPRIQAIKERYGDDRERMQKAMMELYKKEGFNPLAGCWPMLVQFPVFIALYWVLIESVELRQAPFVLWLDDLTAPDPYFVLPVLFGASMYLQQRLSGTTMTMDPMQQRIMHAMPILLTAFFAFFPVGLVLYWVVSNLIGIAQQWYILRKLEREGLKR